MNRGVNKQTIFKDHQDRFYFLKRLGEYKELYHAKIYHWVLMSNHYHMLLEISFDELRPFLAGLQQKYAMYHHSRHGTSGTFWQGRFKSKPVEPGPYLISCGRYIERNPVRASLVTEASEYQWSSAKSYALGQHQSITDLNPFIGNLTEQQRSAYAQTLASGIDDEIIDVTRHTRVIGSKEFELDLKLEHGRCRLKRGRPAGWRCAN